MSYRYQATERFWHNFYGLSPAQKDSARRAWQIFKQDPFDPRLGTHRINRLSGIMRRTVYAVVVEGDLAWSSTWKATRWFRSTSAPTRFTRRDARQIELGMTEWPPSPNSLKSNVGIIGRILRRLPNEVLNEAEKQGNPWTWLAEWVKRNPVERIFVGTVQMRDAECAALEKEGFKRTGIGVYSADTKARHNAKIYQGIREVRFYFHKHDSAKTVMRIVMDRCWPDIFRKTLEAAASQRQATLRLVEVGRRGGSISQSWRLKMHDAQMRGDQRTADHWADNVSASILQMEKGRQWLLNDNVKGLHVPQEIRDEARRRYEKFYAKDVRRLGRKKADKKWKNADNLKTPLGFKRDTIGEKIATALAFAWLSVGDGFPGFCFISDKILATILGLMLPLPSLMAKNDDADNQRGRKIIEDCRRDIGLKKGETLVTGLRNVEGSKWALLDENDEEAGYFNQAKSLPPKLAG